MKFLTPPFVVLGLFVIGGMVFKSYAPRTCGEIMPDDALFVLTGDVRRIPFAMRMPALKRRRRIHRPQCWLNQNQNQHIKTRWR